MWFNSVIQLITLFFHFPWSHHVRCPWFKIKIKIQIFWALGASSNIGRNTIQKVAGSAILFRFHSVCGRHFPWMCSFLISNSRLEIRKTAERLFVFYLFLPFRLSFYLFLSPFRVELLYFSPNHDAFFARLMVRSYSSNRTFRNRADFVQITEYSLYSRSFRPNISLGDLSLCVLHFLNFVHNRKEFEKNKISGRHEIYFSC